MRATIVLISIMLRQDEHYSNTEGLERHALVAERHIGLGITREEIIRQQLPLPRRDMLCESLEEKIICWLICFSAKLLSACGRKNPWRKSNNARPGMARGSSRFSENGVASSNDRHYLLNCLNPSIPRASVGIFDLRSDGNLQLNDTGDRVLRKTRHYRFG